MSYSVTVQPGGLSFAAEPDETLLSAALRQNVALPYGCQQGACGACKCKVTFGQVEPGEALESALSPEEAAQGWALTCRAPTLAKKRAISLNSDNFIVSLTYRKFRKSIL